MTKDESYSVGALRARFADESMPWTRPHVEQLINQIAELTKQRDEGWGQFYRLRKQVAEEKYPGMTQPVRALQVEPPRELVDNLESLLRRVLEWTPALPAESGLLDEIGAALEGKMPVARGVTYDSPGWLCSVCHGWNPIKEQFCIHSHLPIKQRPAENR